MLNVQELAIIPPQFTMLLSELVIDGVVVDIGHELTQIVPFIDGRASYHKARTFPVGAMFIDHVLAHDLFDKSALKPEDK